MSAWMSAARRGLRNTWRWPTDGFSASRPAASSASPTSWASARSLPAKPRARWREVGVVAAPLAHPVEALEDPPGDPARGVGVLVRARGALAVAARAGRARRPRARRPSAGRPAARRAARRPRRSAAGARRRSARAASASAEHARAGTASARRAGGRSRAACSSKASGRELVERPPGRGRRGQASDEEAARASPARDGRSPAPAGAPRLGEVDERADRRRDEQPGALARRVGVGAQRRARPGVAASSRPPLAAKRDLDRPRRGPSARARAPSARARSASSSSPRSCAVAAAGAAVPPASASAAASALCASVAAIGLPYPHANAQAGACPRARAGRLLPRHRAARGRAARRRGLGRATGRTGPSRPCSRASRGGRAAGRAVPRGPGHARVERLDVSEEEPEGLAGFAVD